ncbi:MAG: MBL fold metallo-hydrolase [Tannerellaceae bacterium]|nr:MBL fold metallo-hydrolase [Tannerellaceae bacterium]
MGKLFTLLAGSFLLVSGLFAQENKLVYTYDIGTYKVHLLSENQGQGKPDILIGATPEMLEKYTDNGSFPNAVNAFLVQTGTKNILVDTGFGRELFKNMASVGVAPEQIDVVLITHMHGDHIGGMLQNDVPAFPHAEVYIAQPEYDYWNDQEGETSQKKVIAAYKDKLHLFQPAMVDRETDNLFEGFQGIAAYGHTPGHTMFLVKSGDQQLMIWGDLTHAMAIQMPHPEVAVTYDVDPKAAIESRQKVLQYVAEKNIPVAGMHVAYPGSGYVKASPSGGYTFTPLN